MTEQSSSRTDLAKWPILVCAVLTVCYVIAMAFGIGTRTETGMLVAVGFGVLAGVISLWCVYFINSEPVFIADWCCLVWVMVSFFGGAVYIVMATQLPAVIGMESRDRLKLVAEALWRHGGQNNGRLPPPALLDKDGRPLLSWRVLLLPALGEDELYKRFDLSESWNSPHNLKLLDSIPKVYAPPKGSVELPAGYTAVQAFVGPGTAFDCPNGCHRDEDFPHLGSTVLVVEAGVPVPWTKPQDIVFDPNEPLPPLGIRNYQKRKLLFFDPAPWDIPLGFGDGSVDRVAYEEFDKLEIQLRRAAITREGPEPRWRWTR